MTTAVSWILRLVLGGVFVYAGAVKALDPAAFHSAAESYRLLPYHAAVATALYLPWLEIFCGLALWSGRAYRGALGLLLVLTAVFGIALAVSWARGLDVTCGCFGGTGEANYPWLLARAGLLFAGIAGLVVIEWGRRARETPSQSSLEACKDPHTP